MSVEEKLRLLRDSQNRDGGWGYFPGRKSRIEPTAYAVMALAGSTQADSGWKLLRSWQSQDGSYRSAAEILDTSWATSLCVSIACARGDFDESCKRAVNWLVGLYGADSEWLPVAIQTLRLKYIFPALGAERDVRLKGWPWRPDNAAWVEPTAHALIALRQAALKYPSKELSERVELGEKMLMDRRSQDGGWNSGSPTALKIPLKSYPETTALALLGLQGVPKDKLAEPLALARKMTTEARSDLAQAWLAICLRVFGMEPDPAAAHGGSAPDDLMLASIQALADPAGNYRLFAVPHGGTT